MRRKVLSTLAIFALSAIFFGTLPVRAENSGSQIKTVGGYTYTFYSQALSNSGSISFSTIAFSTQSTPANYVGAYARLYSSNGNLVKATSWSYSATSLATGSMYSTSDTSKYYYSKGKVGFYNGNGYSTYDCYSSPNIAPHSLEHPHLDVTRNDDGQIYGSEYFLNQIGIEPDLIAAIGDDGTIGYVLAEDINVPGASTLDEAESYNAESDKEIPLYNKEGDTVIGKFTIIKGDSQVSINAY